MTRRLVYTFAAGREFFQHFQTRPDCDEQLFLPGVTDIESGQLLDLEIVFRNSGYSFHTQARVISRRLASQGKTLMAGTTVSFLVPRGQRLMKAHAKGQDIAYSPRLDQRVPCNFPARLMHRIHQGSGEVVDYCPGGIQVVGGPQLEVGESLLVHLYPADSLLGLKVVGTVVWIQREPEPAAGISLHPEKKRMRRKLQRLYARLFDPDDDA